MKRRDGSACGEKKEGGKWIGNCDEFASQKEKARKPSMLCLTDPASATGDGGGRRGETKKSLKG